ncbi:putative inositol 5-phosphatase [Myriangium duriaei CBS 260.36]|uniref:Inositol 5-phosphatase n=1 Tax=Myriangium duriaei CBS 260.36 TaxID=1168546 RepID=A0A9P4MLF8_9PEZI|nr:putative inositol 5-phosphatase [Myriangium duriaei CBS 260.36]
MSAELDCCILTFNCGRELVEADLLAGHLHAALSTSSDPPDVLVLALEELAPIAYSFLGGSYLTQYLLRFARVVDTLVKLWHGPDAIRYEQVTSATAGMTALLVFAQPDVARNIERVETAAVRVGNFELGNKGAVAARLHYKKGADANATQLTFVSAHLAPMEERCERRNQDWRTITENMVFQSSGTGRDAKDLSITTNGSTEEATPLLSSQSESRNQSGLYSPESYLFVAGDLNYRTADYAPPSGAAQNWPTEGSTGSNDEFASLWATDQLTRELQAGRTLHHLQEAEVRFAPTYKYSAAAQRQAAGIQSADAPLSNPWASHRVPSWCDRILYLTHGTQLRVGLYNSLPLLPSSDHRAVLFRADVPIGKTMQNGQRDQAVSSPFQLSSDAVARAARSRTKDIFVGMLALLATTWEGRTILLGMLAGAIGSWAVVRSLL